MPKVIERKVLDEKCPECDSQLVKITEEWNPFPDEECPSDVEAKKCGECGYEQVIRDSLNKSAKVPYVKHGKNFQYV